MTAGTEAPSASLAKALQIGDWTVEPELNRLSRGDEAVRIEPKSMAVLVHLADRPGEVVSRSALLSAVWPDVIVGDDSLTQVVIKLRKVLQDAADEPAYIQTISKRGYRLIAVVRPAGESQGRSAQAARTPNAPKDRRAAWLSVAGLVAVLLAAMAGVRWVGGGPDAETAPVSVQAPGPVPARADGPVVAISAFEAMSGDQQEELLAQGITEDLLTDLSKVLGLWIVDARTLGEPRAHGLPIDYGVAGSVQRTDQRLLVRVHLTDARTGRLLWSERFEREKGDLFAMQEELGPRILRLLPAKVTESELRRVSQRHTRSLVAYEAFQRGQRALLARQKAENDRARALFRQAIGFDPAFARALAALALTYAADYRNQWVTPVDAALDRALEIANTANHINLDIPETHWVLAFVRMERREHDRAMRHLETAIRLNPSYADAYGLIGSIQTYRGRPADTLGNVRTAMRLDPGSGNLHFMNLGRAYFFLGDVEQARVNLEQALARNQANLEVHVYLAALHVTVGDNDAAAWEAEEIRSLRPAFSTRDWLRTYPMTDAAQKAKLVRALGELGF